MVAVKKVLPRSDIELKLQNTDSYVIESKPPFSFAGFIFVCSNDTIPDLERRIFGLPQSQAKSVLAIRQGMPLFLYNYSTRRLCGVFEAASDGAMNIDPSAWENTEVRRFGKPPVSRYPAQVKVHLKFQRPPLDEETFRPVLDHIEGFKFRLELSVRQVKQLLELFSVSEREFFCDKGRMSLQNVGTGTGVFMPESPLSAVKVDSDCHSECSSRGTYYGEDDWAEDDHGCNSTIQTYLPHSSLYMCDDFNHLTLKNTQNIDKGNDGLSENILQHDVPVPAGLRFLPCEMNTVSPFDHQLFWKKEPTKSSYHCWPDTFATKEANPAPLRSREVDFLVNSSPLNLMYDSKQVHSEDSDSCPFIPMNQRALYFGQENMFCLPVEAQQAQLLNPSSPAKGNDQKRVVQGLPPAKQSHSPEDANKMLNPCATRKCQHRHCSVLPVSQFGQIYLPIYPAKPGAVYDSNQFGPGNLLDDQEGSMSYSQFYGGICPNILHTGHFPYVLLPPVAPKIPPSPPLFAVGFSEALHFNILEFARLTRPSAEKQLSVEGAIDAVRSCVRRMWLNADVEVYGSFATGLCLQHSDVDLAVINAPLLPALLNMTTSQACSFLLRDLGALLKAAKCCDSYNVIANAAMPVLKCLCRPTINLSDHSLPVSEIAVDITIGGIENSKYQWKRTCNGAVVDRSKQHTGGSARDYVVSKIRELPALAPLIFVVKSFLQHRGLSNVYLGGLGSFSLTLLLIFYLELPLSGEMLCASKDSHLHKLFFPTCGISDLSEDSDSYLTMASSSEDLHSISNSECVNWSLGEHYVRKAAGVIDRVLMLWEAGGVAFLGNLLLGFLKKFGFDHDLAREKIVLSSTDGRPGGIFKRDNCHIALWIDDPMRPGINIAAGSFAMCQVQAAFRELFCALVNGQVLSAPLRCNERDCQDLAAFGQLRHFTRLLIDVTDHDGGGLEDEF
ncbi:hypothetical protein KP509_29G018000 [Ceratopteris richardii]|uniref:DCD domain-containing protein n=1 Tax=Ceratopteris richardii TaxID=49495 RepID=A0A8T2R645_CERRI|nr:hypothetical protein KP509_29G018000 [Ceratopteris richardii]